MNEEKLVEAIVDFANALEAACVQLKRYVGKSHGVAVEEKQHSEEDFNKLSWEKKEGPKGAYEQTNKNANNNSTVFQALQNKLKQTKGFCVHGSFKYWFHKNDQNVIDRRRK